MGNRDLYLTRRLTESGLGATFLSKRLYKIMGYNNPEAAVLFISQISRNSWYIGKKKDDENRRNHAIILYALGTPKDHDQVKELMKHGVEYPPKSGISYEKLKKIREAQTYPGSADTEVLLQFELDEKIRILDDKALDQLESLVDKLIKQGKVMEKSHVKLWEARKKL